MHLFTLAACLELSMQNRNAADLDEVVQEKTKSITWISHSSRGRHVFECNLTARKVLA
jgi:hypothetical protein